MNRSVIGLAAVAAFSVLAIACSSSSDPGTGTGTGTSPTEATSSSSGASGKAASGGTSGGGTSGGTSGAATSGGTSGGATSGGTSGGTDGGAANCVPKGYAGNDKKVGAYCDKDTACPFQVSPFLVCTYGHDPTNLHLFCTAPCSKDSECGTGAFCVHDPQGNGCVPMQCGGMPSK